MPYIKEAGTIFALYATGVIVFIYLATYHITETEYFAGEEGVVIPKHVVAENPEKATNAHIEMTAAGPAQKLTHAEPCEELTV